MRLPLLIVAFIIFSSCKKEIDFRDKYCGNWNFENSLSSFNMSDSSSHDTIIYFDGVIWYDKPDSLNIQYRENDTLRVLVKESGEIQVTSYYPMTGKFDGDSVLTFGYHYGGLGGGGNVSVTGRKK